MLQNITSGISCGFTCNKLWDGHGVWSKQGRWKDYVKNTGKATVRLSSLLEKCTSYPILKASFLQKKS